MTSEVFYRQCWLKRGSRQQVSYIPEKFAKRGKFAKLKEGTEWTDGWEIVYVSEFRYSAGEVSEMSQDYKHQREASDI